MRGKFSSVIKTLKPYQMNLSSTLNIPQNSKVVVAMSGGVDSSVAALLLKNMGLDVQGIYMQNWDPREEGNIRSNYKECPLEADYKDAKNVCEHIEIPLHRVEFISEYWNDVFIPFLEEYQRGNTPNPDVACNREIKFKALLHYVENKLGATHLATGHYARVRINGDNIELLRPIDKSKDQTYFLSQVSKKALSKAIFPLGDLLKTEVRKISHDAGLITANKRESMGICFIGKRKFASFLGEYISLTPGIFRNLSGDILGKHNGVESFTIGQRARISGLPEGMFVVKKDLNSGDVVVVPYLHPEFMVRKISASMTWISGNPPTIGDSFSCKYRIRHTPNLAGCSIELISDGTVNILFDEPEWGVAPQQIVALYNDEICFGGGYIGNSHLL